MASIAPIYNGFSSATDPSGQPRPPPDHVLNGRLPVWTLGISCGSPENRGKEIGGRGGIRTHGWITPSPDFESGAFNHSATLPQHWLASPALAGKRLDSFPLRNPTACPATPEPAFVFPKCRTCDPTLTADGLLAKVKSVPILLKSRAGFRFAPPASPLDGATVR